MIRINPIAATCWSTPKMTPRLPASSADPRIESEAFAHADALTTLGRIFDVTPAAGEKNNADHQPKQKQSEISEAVELREHETHSSVELIIAEET